MSLIGIGTCRRNFLAEPHGSCPVQSELDPLAAWPDLPWITARWEPQGMARGLWQAADMPADVNRDMAAREHPESRMPADAGVLGASAQPLRVPDVPLAVHAAVADAWSPASDAAAWHIRDLRSTAVSNASVRTCVRNLCGGTSVAAAFELWRRRVGTGYAEVVPWEIPAPIGAARAIWIDRSGIFILRVATLGRPYSLP